MWLTAFGKKLTRKQIAELLTNGQTKEKVKGLKKKDGSTLEAMLELDFKTGNYKPIFK